jgi:hypothetical protein
MRHGACWSEVTFGTVLDSSRVAVDYTWVIPFRACRSSNIAKREECAIRDDDQRERQ